MPGRSRQSQPAQSQAPASSMSPSPGFEQQRGNAFIQEQIAIQGPNMQMEGYSPRDPEALGDAGLTHNGVWDPQYILSNLSQVDNDHANHTIFDGSRCGPSSLLAVHIQGGPEAVRSVANETLSTLGHIQNVDRGVVEGVSHLAGFQHPNNASFEHLNALQEALYIIANVQAGGNDRLDAEASAIRAGDLGYGTSQEEMDRLDMLGRNGDWGGRDSPSIMERIQGTEMGLHGQRAALSLPLPSGVQNGPGGLDEMVAALRTCRNVAYILGVPVPGEESEQIGHGITFGVDAQGRIYCYDPLPREGSQLMHYSSDREEIEGYVSGNWTVMDRVASAGGGHADPR